MTKPETIDPDMTVDEIMRRWPATIRVMIRNRMLCIGCPIGVFHTVLDACEAHRVDLEAFSKELLEAMNSDPAANAPSAFDRERSAVHRADGPAFGDPAGQSRSRGRPVARS